MGAHKSFTTQDVTTGIVAAISGALENSKCDRSAVSSVVIGTTHVRVQLCIGIIICII